MSHRNNTHNFVFTNRSTKHSYIIILMYLFVLISVPGFACGGFPQRDDFWDRKVIQPFMKALVEWECRTIRRTNDEIYEDRYARRGIMRGYFGVIMICDWDMNGCQKVTGYND